MTSVFVSHSSADNEETRVVHAWLHDRGYNPIFVDYDKKDGFYAGEMWRSGIFNRIRRSQIVLLLLSENWLSSKWCDREFSFALAEGKALVPIRIKDCDPVEIRQELHYIDLIKRQHDEWAALQAALEQAGARATTFHPKPDRAPFPGLLPFEENDAAYFFGRDFEISQIIAGLRNAANSDQSRLMVLAGPSGSGKSSILRAGIIARLRRSPAEWLCCRVYQPIGQFMETFENTLFNSVKEFSGQSMPLRHIAQHLNCDPPNIAALADIVRSAAGQPDAIPLIIIDQAELIFRAQSEQKPEAIKKLIAALGRPPSPFVVLFTLRSDALGLFQSEDEFETFAVDSIYSLPPMPRVNYSQLIDGPCLQYSRLRPTAYSEPEFTRRILRDAIGDDALPLLAYTLGKIWTEEACGDGVLRSSYYPDGYIAKAVSERADVLIKGLAADRTTLDAVRDTFVFCLSKITERGEPLSQPFKYDLVPEPAKRIIAAFVEARLLSTDIDEKSEVIVHVSHEALLRHWSTYTGWKRSNAIT